MVLVNLHGRHVAKEKGHGHEQEPWALARSVVVLTLDVARRLGSGLLLRLSHVAQYMSLSFHLIRNSTASVWN